MLSKNYARVTVITRSTYILYVNHVRNHLATIFNQQTCKESVNSDTLTLNLLLKHVFCGEKRCQAFYFTVATCTLSLVE